MVVSAVCPRFTYYGIQPGYSNNGHGANRQKETTKQLERKQGPQITILFFMALLMSRNDQKTTNTLKRKKKKKTKDAKILAPEHMIFINILMMPLCSELA